MRQHPAKEIGAAGMLFLGGTEPCTEILGLSAAGSLGGWTPTVSVLCPGTDGVGNLQQAGLCPGHLCQRAGVGQHVASRRPPRLQLRHQVSDWGTSSLPTPVPADGAQR